MLKKIPVVMLPTNQTSKIHLNGLTKRLVYSISELEAIEKWKQVPQHLYFLSDEEIKEGEWICIIHSSGVLQINKVLRIKGNKNSPMYETFYRHKGLVGGTNKFKKIIATTDESLSEQIMYYPDGGIIGNKESYKSLPQPSQSFIERFIERYNAGAPITHVMVEYVMGGKFETFKEMKEFKPHLLVNPKDNTITIKPVKDSYTVQELIEFGRLVLDTFHSEGKTHSGKDRLPRIKYDNWIEQNL